MRKKKKKKKKIGEKWRRGEKGGEELVGRSSNHSGVGLRERA